MRAKIIISLVIALAVSHGMCRADLITGPASITPSTSINFNGGFGSLAQIADGIDLNSDASPYNGYGPNATFGAITLSASIRVMGSRTFRTGVFQSW